MCSLRDSVTEYVEALKDTERKLTDCPDEVNHSEGSSLIDGSVQNCSISTTLAMEMLQSCTKPSKYIHDIVMVKIIDKNKWVMYTIK